MDPIQHLQLELAKFAKDRHWERFHSPKNLSMALSVEASELLEHFQWLTEEESRQLNPDKLQEVRDEMADVFLYLLQMSIQLDVDLAQAARDKLLKNAIKYPAP